jgi:hypothetical protein
MSVEYAYRCDYCGEKLERISHSPSWDEGVETTISMETKVAYNSSPENSRPTETTLHFHLECLKKFNEKFEDLLANPTK